MSRYKKFLNPLYKEIDQISNFSDIKINDDLSKEEYPYLEKTVKYACNSVATHLKTLDSLEEEIEEQIRRIENETGDDKAEAVSVYNKILKQIYVQVERIDKDLLISDSPYFGKIVVDRKGSVGIPARVITSYIGKFAVFNTDTKEMIVTDWRAPIANLYYTNSGPTKNVTFTSPLGEIKGDLLSKRQFEITRGRITHIYDSISGNVSADAFLLAQLKKRLGKKLTDIVATIQEQQNGIIRDDINKFILLQGVAGSGKTTIVLHRLAYLFFTFPEIIRPENTLIMAPNRMFLDYISDVLPSLGIRNVEANTYIFWAKKILGWGDKHVISNVQANLKVREEKGCIEAVGKMKKFFEQFEKKLLEDLPYSDSFIVEQRYYELKEMHDDIALLERLKLSCERAFMKAEMNSKKIGRYLSDGVSDATKERIDSYIKKNTNVLNIYKDFLNSKYFSKETKEYSKKTLRSVNRVFTYTQEDLAPLIWLHRQIYGDQEHIKDYIVADEAQDMSPFEIYTLLLFAKRNNLFLAGDLAQSIIPPFYIKSWNEIIQLLESENKNFRYSYHQLNRCYRTTVEIIEYANNLFKKHFPSDYTLPEAVLRHGENVKEVNIKNNISQMNSNELKEFANLINEDLEKGAVTIAIICKDDNHSVETYDKLIENKDLFNEQIFTYSENDYKTGILVLPVSKAKGLEFDSVFLADVNDSRYSTSELDIRLLYVAITRPLHRLYILKSVS